MLGAPVEKEEPNLNRSAAPCSSAGREGTQRKLRSRCSTMVFLWASVTREPSGSHTANASQARPATVNTSDQRRTPTRKRAAVISDSKPG